MNRAEVLELKKQYKIKNCGIQRVSGYLVNGEHVKLLSFNDRFLSKPEDEQFKYLEIFKKGLSGIGKNLNTLSIEDGDVKRLLNGIVSSHLEPSNQPLLDTLFMQMANCFTEVENALILAIFNQYDIPNRNEDGLKDGESVEVYSYISVYVCPLTSEKAGLCYDPQTDKIKKRELRKIVDMPEYSFIYPSFEERSSDYNSITVYEKTDKYHRVTTDFLKCDSISYKKQQKLFDEIVEEAIGELDSSEDTFEVIKTINNEVSSIKDNKISISNIEKILEKSNLPTQSIKEAVIGNNDTVKTEFNTELIAKPKLKIKTEGIELSVKNEDSSRIERRTIDGKEYILIELNDMPLVVNGVVIKK